MLLKKAVVILTFVLIAIFSLGAFLFYYCYLSSYKKDFKSFIKKDRSKLYTTKIIINPSQLYSSSKTIIWEDNNKEIILNGTLYDIVAISSNKGKVEITLLSDEKEQEIKKQFASLYKENDLNSPTNNLAKILKQFLGLKFLSNNYFDLNSNQNTIICSHIPFNHIKSKSVFLPQEVPPPIFI
ncbi:MAG: hypothetical protein SFY56_09055 [Bacteroidota bacterium]|nr:hypothetical protein [Bacteroidota bacterium]